MATSRAMKAAREIIRTHYSGAGEAEYFADLIDRAAGLPELEARVAEAKAGWEHWNTQAGKLRIERDALQQRLDAVIDHMQEFGATDDEDDHRVACEVLRLARGRVAEPESNAGMVSWRGVEECGCPEVLTKDGFHRGDCEKLRLARGEE